MGDFGMGPDDRRRRADVVVGASAHGIAVAIALVASVALGLAGSGRTGAAELPNRAAANRDFIAALRLINQADRTYTATRERDLLGDADRLLRGIIDRYPDTDLAVQLMTNQFIGDFDFFQFKARVRTLVCSDPLSTSCFLERLESLLPPVETPIAAARWDWLSLAVAHHLSGRPERAREIIAPFLSAVRRRTPPEGVERDLFVARALALTGEIEIALALTRTIDTCSTRLYNLTDIVEILVWHDQIERAATLAAEAEAFAGDHDCDWERGLVVQALLAVGRHPDAEALFRATVDRQFVQDRASRADCCPPELAVAAAELGDVNLTLGLLRTVQDANPWTLPTVLGRLAARGDGSLAVPYADQIVEPEIRAETYATLVRALAANGRGDDARSVMTRLDQLIAGDSDRRPTLLAQRAKAEDALFDDDRWRRTFFKAVVDAERATGFVRRDAGGPLLAALVQIETDRPLLD